MAASARTALEALGEAVNIAKRNPDGRVGKAYRVLAEALATLEAAQAAPVVQVTPALAPKARKAPSVAPLPADLPKRPPEGDARPSLAAQRFAGILPRPAAPSSAEGMMSSLVDYASGP